jgi:hypothetical protein
MKPKEIVYNQQTGSQRWLLSKGDLISCPNSAVGFTALNFTTANCGNCCSGMHCFYFEIKICSSE